MLISPIYTWIESKTRTDFLIYGLGIFVTLLVMLSYFLVIGEVDLYTGLALLILYQLIYYLRQTQFWGLTALSFNVLQSKRLFSVVSAGDLPAKFLGYTVVFKLLESGMVMPENLIYFAIAAYMISFYFLKNVFKGDYHLRHSSHEDFRSGVKQVRFFGNHLIKSMSILAFFIMFVVFIIDYSFTKVVMHKINQEDADMYLLVSTVLYVGYGVASVLKVFVTGKVFQHLGLRWTIIITPTLLLVLIVLTYFVSIGSGNANWFYVRLFIFLYISFIIFRDVIGKPVFLSLFQPLSKKMRLKGHNVVKGVAEPLGMVVSGSLMLIYFGYFKEYHLSLFAAILVLPLIFWLISSVNVRRIYNKTLEGIINLRLLSGDQYLLIDEQNKAILEKKLKSDDEVDILFGLNQLKNYPIPEEVLENLIIHKSSVVRNAAWEIIAEISSFESLLSKIAGYRLINKEEKTISCLYNLVGEKANNFQDIETLLNNKDPEKLENLFSGWFKNKRQIPEKAREIVNQILIDQDAKYKLSGLRMQRYIPSESGRSMVIQALDSKDENTVKAAIKGACGLLDKLMVERLIGKLSQPRFSHHVKIELSMAGDPAIPFLLDKLEDSDNPISFKIIQVIGHMKTERSGRELLDLLRSYSNPDLRFLILELLNHIEKSQLEEYYSLFYTEIEKEARLFAKLNVSDDFLKKHSFLQDDLDGIIRRIFRLLSFLYEHRIINRAMEGYFSGKPDLKANAIETMSQLIKPEHFKKIKYVLQFNYGLNQKRDRQFNVKNLYVNQESLNKWTLVSLLATYPVDDEKIIVGLQKRKADVISEFLNNRLMEKNDKLRIMEKVILLKRTSLFQGTPENLLVEIAGLLEEKNYKARTTIFKKGEVGNCMYIIYSGKVRIHDGDSIFAVFDQNNFFGDLAMLDTQERSASATTETDATLFRLDQSAIYEIMDDRVEVAQGIIKVLCHRIRSLNERYVAIEKSALN